MVVPACLVLTCLFATSFALRNSRIDLFPAYLSYFDGCEPYTVRWPCSGPSLPFSLAPSSLPASPSPPFTDSSPSDLSLWAGQRASVLSSLIEGLCRTVETNLGLRTASHTPSILHPMASSPASSGVVGVGGSPISASASAAALGSTDWMQSPDTKPIDPTAMHGGSPAPLPPRDGSAAAQSDAAATATASSGPSAAAAAAGATVIASCSSVRLGHVLALLAMLPPLVAGPGGDFYSVQLADAAAERCVRAVHCCLAPRATVTTAVSAR